MTTPSAVRIAVLFPEALGTYGDNGNGLALSHRARARGLTADLVQVTPGEPIPLSCDVYLLGGSEDGPQEFVAGLLEHSHLEDAVDRGAAIFGVCSGMQLLGREFPGRNGMRQGLGLLPCVTVEPQEGQPRTVGEAVVQPVGLEGVGQIVGFENHRLTTVLDPDAIPLGRCVRGYGNDRSAVASHRMDGVVQDRVVGTYLHGPVLALNPALADAVLGLVLGSLPDVDDPRFDAKVESARRRRLNGRGPA